MKYYLAIDIGASSGRHIVGWMENGEWQTDEIYRFPNGVTELDGHLTWDIESLTEQVIRGTDMAREKNDLESLAIDTWGSESIKESNAYFAQIGRPYPGMMDLYIDETNLYHRMWLYTKQFDWEKMWAIADDIDDDEAIREKAQDILDTFDIEGGGTISWKPKCSRSVTGSCTGSFIRSITARLRASGADRTT